jgi:hypothetical protein
MSQSSLFSTGYRWCGRQRYRWNRHCASRIHSGCFMFLLGCLVILLAACLAGSASPSSPAARNSSSTSRGPTPTPTETVAPGTVLYQTDWSHGLDGWKVTGGWSVVQGDLEGVCDDTTTITAPYMPDVTNYAVEARIQVVRLLQKNGGFYSIFASQVPGKDGYQAGVSRLVGPGPRPNGSNPQLQIYIEPFGAMAPGSFQPSDNDPGTQWHTYRVDVQGNAATLVVDGVTTHSVSSTQTDLLSNGPLGLSCGMIVLRVSSFRILAL